MMMKYQGEAFCWWKPRRSALPQASYKKTSEWLAYFRKGTHSFQETGHLFKQSIEVIQGILVMRATTLAPLVSGMFYKNPPLCHLWFLHASCNYPHLEDQPMVKSVEMLRGLPLTLPYWVGFTISLFGKSISISRRWASDLLWWLS